MIPHSCEADIDPESLPGADEVELMAYLDGELCAQDAARVESRLRLDPHFAARCQALQMVNGFLREDANRLYASARVDSIADDVMARIELAQNSYPHSAEREEDMPSFADLQLMAYLDGELIDSERKEVETRLEKDAGFRGKLRGLEATQAFVREDAGRVYDALGVHAIADNVMTQIEAQDAKRNQKKVASVHSLDARRNARTQKNSTQELRVRKATVVWVAFGSIVAAAAAIVFFVQTQANPNQLANGLPVQDKNGAQDSKITSGIAPTIEAMPTPAKPNPNDEVEMVEVASKIDKSEAPEIEIEDLGNATVVTGEGSPHAIIMNDQDEAGEGSNAP
jgi:anti-sigma factor RsiW